MLEALVIVKLSRDTVTNCSIIPVSQYDYLCSGVCDSMMITLVVQQYCSKGATLNP